LNKGETTMSTSVHTLVGMTLDSTNIAVQGVGYNLNPEYLKAKATATVAFDMVAKTGFSPQITAETYDLKTLSSILNNGFSKTISTAYIYAGKVTGTPSDPSIYYQGTGSLRLEADDSLLLLNSISVDKRQPLRCELVLRGSLLDSTSYGIQNFSVTHKGIYTASSFEVTDGTNTLVECGINNLTFNLNPSFYDHYETALMPEFSAVTGFDPQMSATVLLSGASDLLALTTCADLKLNLVKFQPCGAEPIDAGSITFGNATFSVENVDMKLGDVATAQIVAFPKSITISIT